MATKSIIKTITIKEREKGNKLVKAIERSQAEKKQITLTRPCREVKGSDIKEFFNKNQTY